MKKIVLGTVGLLMACVTTAKAQQVHFSADAIMKLPNATSQKGQLFVGKAGTRFDYSQQGRKISKIDLPSAGIVRMVFIDLKQYLEYKIPVKGAASVGQANQPCQSSSHVVCKKVGDETFNSLKVERWTMLPKGAPKPIEILWNKTRKMMVSQVLPNGAKIISKLIGKEKYENLDAERWETAFTAPDGSVKKGKMIYSPKLEVALVETQPNGASKELHNIKLAKQNEALFAVPAGFTKIDQPASTGSIAK